jgi:maltose alpha-D-glucosyltransferase/alpha-amylase
MDPVYGYEAVNVEAQSRSLSSLLNATKRLISVRKSTLAFGRGTMTFIRPANRAVLAYVRQYKDEVILCVANLSRSAQATELDLSAFKDRVPIEMLGRSRFPAIGDLPYMITLAPYGFYWFQLKERDKSEPVVQRAVPEFETLVVPLGSTWVSLARTRSMFERDVLPGYLARTRWYPERSADMIQPTLTSAIPFCDIGDNRPWLIFFKAAEQNETIRYLLPMQIEWVRFDRERYNPQAFAAVRQGAREGTLLDAATSPIFLALLLHNLRQSLTVEENGLRLEFRPTSKFPDKPIRESDQIRIIETDRCNSIAVVENEYFIKLHRQLDAGLHPEIDMGHFLTEVAGFANVAPLLGSVEIVQDGERRAVGTVHGFVENQGNGWSISAAYLDRFIDERRVRAANEDHRQSEEQPPYLRYMTQAGRRVGELHAALASNTELADFAPEPTSADDVDHWIDTVRAQAARVYAALSERRDGFRDVDRALLDQVLAKQPELFEQLSTLLPHDVDGQNIRLHGDFHLGQILIVKDDICIVDFDGNEALPLTERRRKAPPARDVAGFLRSIDCSVRVALERASKTAPDDGRLAAALSEWRDQAVAAFMAGYHEIRTNQRLWPADPHAVEAMLSFFMLEKSIAEIEYELAHRPDWLRIALSNLLRVLSIPVR